MPLINVIVVLIVVGFLLWLVNRFIPMASSVKSLLNAVVTIFLVIWLLKAFGLWDQILHILNIHVGS